jgi:hypothetical protein
VKVAITAAALAAAVVWNAFAQSRAPADRSIGTARLITWKDVAAVAGPLQAGGVTAAGFDAYLERIRSVHARRVREGDLDHVVFYMLQSRRFTKLPPIEPALSAKAVVEPLDAAARTAFLAGDDSRVAPPHDVRARAAALSRALDGGDRDPRLDYIRTLAVSLLPAGPGREAALVREYLRAMRFVYEKEFVAQSAAEPAGAVADLYRTRGLSTDTAVEAGFLISIGLGTAKGLAPDTRIRRALIVGPGLDLAPRTGLLEAGAPESYQPWAVIDALLGLGLATLDDLVVVGADINTRVVQHLRRSAARPPRLTLVSEIAEGDQLTLTSEYREYFDALGRHIGRPVASQRSEQMPKGHLVKTIDVTADAARTLGADRLDIVIERLDGAPFDLVIATNVLPYFDDMELAMAMSNIASMLAPGGLFLHNEARPLLGELAKQVGVPFEQSRHAVIANVKDAKAPLFDSVFLHRKKP